MAAVTHDQQIAKLKAEIARLNGEIAGLKYAVAMRPWPQQYVPAPAPRVYPYPTYPFGPTWVSSQSYGIGSSAANQPTGASN